MLTNPLTNEPVSDAELLDLSQLVQRQILVEEIIADKQKELAAYQDELKKISETLIPELLLGIGLTQLKMATGESVTVDKFYSASIPAERRDETFGWLRKVGCDDIIKNEIKLLFGKGEDKIAEKVAKSLIKQGYTPDQKIFVHPMTLKSFVRERIESGAELPQELFGVFIGNRTKITPAKK
jgi:hypothetical protein